MTVSNISSNIQMMVNSMTAQSADSEMNLLTQTSGLTGTGTVTNGFADVIGKVNTDLQDSVPAASKTTGIKSEDQETSYKKATQSKTSDSKVDKADTKKVTKDDAEEIESDIKDIIKDALSIDDEQLEKAMAELGITTMDLLNPTNVANLIAQVNGVETTDIMMSEDLSTQLQNAMSSIQSVLEDFAETNQIPVDSLIETLTTTDFEPETEVPVETPVDSAMSNNSENTDDSSVQEQPQIMTVVDASTGKEITITVEHNTTTSEEVQFTDRPQAEKADTDAQEDNEGSQNRGTENGTLGGQLIQNLTDAVSDATQTGESFANAYTSVNATDVINQMLDAVKVNVTNSIQSMEIQLTPENLGKLNLTVVAKDGAITASITAQNEAVKSALENQMISLKNSLNEAGLKVDSVEVTVAERQADSNMMNQNGQGESNDNAKSNARRRFRGMDEIPEEESEETAANVLEEGNSINLTA